MKYEIKALGLGEILDQAIKLIKDKFGLLMGIMALTVIPSQIAIGYFSQLMQPQAGQPPQLGSILPLLGGVYFFMLVILPLSNAAVVYATARTYLGQSVTLKECFGHGFRRLLPLLWTSILMGIAIMGGLILFVIPGLLCIFWFMLAQQVTVLETMNGFPALSRSKALMKGNIGTAFVLSLIVGVINIGLSAASNVVPSPFNIILGAVIAGGVTLVSTCSLVVFYFSCRCKLDNFDLEVLAEEVGSGEVELGDDQLSVEG